MPQDTWTRPNYTFLFINRNGKVTPAFVANLEALMMRCFSMSLYLNE